MNPITPAAALMRIACTGITLRQAQGMDDATLLRFPLIGRRTLRFIRASVTQAERGRPHNPRMDTMLFTIIFRVLGGDVYEIPVEAKSYAGAQARALAFIGVRRADVIVCR